MLVSLCNIFAKTEEEREKKGERGRFGMVPEEFASADK